MKKNTSKIKRKISKEEKVLRLYEYLKKYTDRSHPASLQMITEYFGEKYFGTKDTRKNLIHSMTVAANSDKDGNILPKNEWRIVYDDFARDYDTPNATYPSHHICNIYFNQPFSDDDIDKLFSSITANPNLSEEDKKSLKEKIRTYICTDNYNTFAMTPQKRRELAYRQKKQKEEYQKILAGRLAKYRNSW